MDINTNDYQLDSNNYIATEHPKKHIILANTLNVGFRHFSGWKHRDNGNYKKTAPFTVLKDGTVYQHYDPKYYSSFIKNLSLSSKSIVILLENLGWVTKNLDKNQFITWVGDIYSDQSEIFVKKWRGHEYWVAYEEKQVEATVNLVRYLCEQYDIPKTVISHNTMIDRPIDYQGVLYRSNIDKYNSDLNPSWDFNEFKNKIENDER